MYPPKTEPPGSPKRLPPAPEGVRPDILAVALDTDWPRMWAEYTARLDELMGSDAAAIWAAPLRLDELCEAGRHAAVCHRMFQKICDLEEQV